MASSTALVKNSARILQAAKIVLRMEQGNSATLGQVASSVPSVAKLSSVTDAHFQLKPFKLHKLDSGPKTETHLTRDDALRYYRQMQVIRRMETSANSMYKEKQIRGFCHLYSGQEACAVGMRAAMTDLDCIITAYRCHGWGLLMGIPIVDILSELAGRVTGNVFGKGGSMHMYTKNFYGGNGIVGAQVPLGAGIAFAQKYRGEKAMTVSLYGDGAANQGQLFEAMNMAKLWGLPCIFVCENNGYGMGTPAERASASTEYYTRGDYVPGIWVDAMDVLGVREATVWAGEYCKNGHGPLVMELATYRYYGHSMSDPGTSYRKREEIQEVRKSRDPISSFKDRILSANMVSEEELKEIDTSVRKEVDEAVKTALRQEYPPIELVYTDLYKSTSTEEILIRGATPEQWIQPPHENTIGFLKKMGYKIQQKTAVEA